MLNRLVGTIFPSAVIAAALVAVFTSVLAPAAPVFLPHTFTAFQSLPAAWLNDNYGALATSVNSIDSNQLATNSVITSAITAGAVTTAKLADAPNGVTTGKISDLGVTTAKLALGASLPGEVTALIPTGVALTTVEGTVVQLPSLTTRGGKVLLFGGGGLEVSMNGATTGSVILRVYRDATPIQNFITTVQNVNAANVIVPLPIPLWRDNTVAGSYVYKLTAQVIGAGIAVTTSPSLPGSWFAWEFA